MRISNPDVPFGGVVPNSTNFPLGLDQLLSDWTISDTVYDEIMGEGFASLFPSETDYAGTYLCQATMHLVGGATAGIVHCQANVFYPGAEISYAQWDINVPAGATVLDVRNLLLICTANQGSTQLVRANATVSGIVAKGVASAVTPYCSMHFIKLGGLANQ